MIDQLQVYEETWGGVCSTCGLHDEQCDFGNGMYNDHHFHYGYHIYTAAVLARADPAWGEKWNERWEIKKSWIFYILTLYLPECFT